MARPLIERMTLTPAERRALAAISRAHNAAQGQNSLRSTDLTRVRVDESIKIATPECGPRRYRSWLAVAGNAPTAAVFAMLHGHSATQIDKEVRIRNGTAKSAIRHALQIYLSLTARGQSNADMKESDPHAIVR